MAYGNTKLSNLVNPKVMADLVQKKLTNNLVFGVVADIDTTLVGTPGDTLLFPSYSYIGAASQVGEGSTISVVTLTASTVSATVVKWATGCEITDEAALSGYGEPLNEATNQIALSLRDAVDNAMLATLNSDIASTMTYETASTATDPKATDINLALELYGEDIADGVKVAFVSPAVYTQLRTTTGWLPASEIAAAMVIRGAVGEAYGCQIVVTNKLTTPKNIYIVKPGALRLILKKDVEIEADRDILKKETVITGAIHGVTYLYDASKAIKIKKKS